jgi:hypothetical protein
MEVAMLSRSIVSLLTVSGVSGALGLLPLATAHASSAAYGAADYGTTCAAPFDNPDTITSVKPYKVIETNLKRSSTHVEGAVITVAAEPGMTREWLQRQVQEPASTAQPGCPLAVNGASARVTSTGNGFDITVQGKDKESSKEILRRAEALTSSSP